MTNDRDDRYPLPPIRLTLRVNGQIHATVHAEEPVLFSISAINQAAAVLAPRRLAQAKDREELKQNFEHGRIKEAEFHRRMRELEKTEEIYPVIRFGSPSGWTHLIRIVCRSGEFWQVSPWLIHTLIAYPAQEYVQLDERTQAYLELGLDPEDAAQIPPGEYVLKAALEIESGICVESEPVSVTLVKDPLPVEQQFLERYYTTHGTYWFKRGDYDQAVELILQGLSRFPKSVSLRILQGDIETERHHPLQALEAYEEALESIRERYPDLSQPPDALLRRISDLRSRLKE